MTTPEQALDRARAALRDRRAAGDYPPAPGPQLPTSPAEVHRRLIEWAFVEPAATVLRSTRSHGAPITALKRVLLRLLGQYLTELSANQARFNLTLIAHLEQLEERLAALEARARDGEPPPP